MIRRNFVGILQISVESVILILIYLNYCGRKAWFSLGKITFISVALSILDLVGLSLSLKLTSLLVFKADYIESRQTQNCFHFLTYAVNGSRIFRNGFNSVTRKTIAKRILFFL